MVRLEGTHEDLVLAVALACWFGEMIAAAPIREQDEEPFDAFSPEAKRAEYERGHRVKPHLDRVERKGAIEVTAT